MPVTQMRGVNTTATTVQRNPILTTTTATSSAQGSATWRPSCLMFVDTHSGDQGPGQRSHTIIILW